MKFYLIAVSRNAFTGGDELIIEEYGTKEDAETQGYQGIYNGDFYKFRVILGMEVVGETF